MRTVYINSSSHYQLKADNEKLLLIEYMTGDHDDENNMEYDLCPHSEQRNSFLPSEGKVIEEFYENEEIEFIYDSFESKVTKKQASGTIVCGDNLRYYFDKQERKYVSDVPTIPSLDQD